MINRGAKRAPARLGIVLLAGLAVAGCVTDSGNQSLKSSISDMQGTLDTAEQDGTFLARQAYAYTQILPDAPPKEGKAKPKAISQDGSIC